MRRSRRRKKKVVEQLNALLKSNGQQVTPTKPATQNPPQPAERTTYTTSVAPQQTRINYANFSQTHANVGMSLKNMHTSASQKRQQTQIPQQQPTTQPSTVQQTVNQSSTIDVTQFVAVWNRFAQNIAQSNPRLFSLMANAPMLDGNKIIVKVQNQFQIDEIAGNAELINFLRNTFKNKELFIHAEIDKNAAGKQEVVYTSRQQFEKMSQQNKELLKLMEHYGFFLDN